MTTVVVSPVPEPEPTPIVVKVRRRSRIAAWFRRIGEKLRAGYARVMRATKHGLTRTWSATKTAGSTTVSWVRRAAAASGRAAKSVGRRGLRIGLSVGRGIGRVTRFLGHSVLTFALAIPRFLVRTTGWMVRGVSWSLRTGLKAMFNVSFAALMVIGLVTLILAWTHDKYEERVHNHARAWSTGAYEKPWQEGPMAPSSARGTTGDFANDYANRVGAWEAQYGEPPAPPVVKTEAVITEDVTPSGEQVVKVETPDVTVETVTTPDQAVVQGETAAAPVAPEEAVSEGPIPLAYAGDAGPVREGLTDLTVGDLTFRVSNDLLREGHQRLNWNMSGMLDPRYSEDDMYTVLQMMDLANHLKSESTRDHPVLDVDLASFGYQPSANQIFQNGSYWEGRMHVVQNWRTEEIEDPNEAIDKSVEGMKMYWPIYLRDYGFRFDNRELHRASFKRGWDDQVKWYEEHLKQRLLTPEQREAREQAERAASAKKRGGRATKKV